MKLVRTTAAIALLLTIVLTFGSASAGQPSPAAAPAGAALPGGVQPAALLQAPLDPGPQTAPETLYRAINPCRVVDTRRAGGAIPAAGSRAFYITGTSGFAPQGGQSGGCGIPSAATAVAATLVAVNPTGSGFLKAWPEGSPEPTSSVLNYVRTAGALSTGVTLTIRTLFTPNLRIRNLGPAVHLVLDVQGYYIPQIQALIASDGGTNGGTPRIVGTSHPGTGSYYITLDRPARQCSPSVNTYNIYRYASVGLSASTTPNVISVYIWSLNSSTHAETPENYPFFLTVTC